MNQGTHGYSLTKKTKGQKSRETVPLIQGWQNPGFFQKIQPGWFFWVLSGFLNFRPKKFIFTKLIPDN
jgi:hypothetical protein